MGRERRGGRFIVLSREVLLVYAFLILIVILDLGFGFSYGHIRRAMHGAASGVMLEDNDVSGLLREEVRALTEKLAEERRRDPIPAMAFVETGEIIEGIEGIEVDIEATVERVMNAGPGERVRLAEYKVKHPVTGDFFKPVRSVVTTEKVIAFCINVAWGEEFLPDMLGILEDNGVKATFFFVGRWVKLFPDLVREISSGGHEIANHGYTHSHPNQLGKDELRRLILDNDELLRSVAGRSSNLFAPPYGEYNEKVLEVAGSLGFRTILWSIDTIDWQRPEPQVIVDRVLKKLHEGGIVLMHPTQPTVKALPIIINEVQKRGYRIVSLSDLLRAGKGVR